MASRFLLIGSCALGCAHAVSVPRAAVMPSTSAPAPAVVSSRPLPAGGPPCAIGPAVRLEHLQPNGLGSFLLGALNGPLSTAPLQAPHDVLRGSPALVVDVAERNGKAWRRVLGADGGIGWLEGDLAEVPGQLSVPRDIELTDRIAPANAVLGEHQTTPIPGGSAAGGSAADVLEASDATYPETMSQLGTSWAKARSYPTQAEACQQLRASNVPAPVMRVGPNVSCNGAALTGGKR